ncbi:MAG TPA: hypothetical protein VMG59_05200 [Phycisphaerae bacterium]|nr:hypothetical protein [Phycisphaerae bacterium]
MATIKPSRSTPPYGLIVCIFLLVVSIIVSVFLGIQLGKAQQTASNATDQLNLFVSPGEQESQAVQNLYHSATTDNTVFSQLNEEIRNLKFTINGRSANSLSVNALVGPGGIVSQTLRQSGISNNPQLARRPLLELVSVLATQTQQTAAQLQAIQGQLAGNQQDFDSAKTSFTDDLNAINSKLDDAQQRITDLTNQLNQANSDEATQLASVEQKRSDDQTKYVSELQLQLVQIQQLQQELSNNKDLIDQLRDELGQYRSPQEGANAILSQADGKVIGVSLVDGNVYINLGAADHVTVGLTFAVYNPDLGVGSGEEAGGKGSIIITNVAEHASVAKITNLATDEEIYPGDLIANPVYHRDLTRKYHFVVYGDFDMNGNGIPTAHGRNQVIRMIEDWGGVVDDKLTSQTDFLVLGAPPGSPEIQTNGAATPQTTAIDQMQAQNQQEYANLEQEAGLLSVPILNANRFLAMIGYYASPLTTQ